MRAAPGSLATWSSLASLFVLGAALGAALLFLLYRLFFHSIAKSRRVFAAIPDSGPISFPLGSLGSWDDLLKVNRRILRETSAPPATGVRVLPGVVSQVRTRIVWTRLLCRVVSLCIVSVLCLLACVHV